MQRSKEAAHYYCDWAKQPAAGDFDLTCAAQRFSVKLTYNGQHWKSVDLPLAHNEIGIADHVVYALAPELTAIFESLDRRINDYPTQHQL